MKATRAYEHDIQVIREIHQHSPLNLETLVDRFVKEMLPIGHPVRIRGNFLTVIESLFQGAQTIVCATDAGREGELIFRYILEFTGARGKRLLRLWLNSLTQEAIRVCGGRGSVDPRP